MPAGYLGNLGQLGLGIDRMEGQLPASMYDPSQFINPSMLPYMGMYLQPQMMKQMANFQNPQLMLPQNSGSFFANAIGKLFGAQTDNGLAQSSQTQSQQGQGGQPNNPLLQQLYGKRNQFIQGGMPAGQAEYTAASGLMGNPQFQDPNSQAVLGRFLQDAMKNGYDPKQLQSAQLKAPDNYQNTNPQSDQYGKIVGMTQPQWSARSDRDDWIRAENMPQVAPGRVQEFKRGGQYYAMKQNPDGSWSQVGKSTSPAQFIRSTAIDVSGDEINKYPGLMEAITTGSAADLTREKIAAQQTHVANFDSITGNIQSLLSQGAAGGKAGDWFEKIDDAIGTVGKFADTIGDTDTFNSLVKNSPNANIGNMGGIITRFKLSGKQAIQVNTALNAAAYEWWRAQNPEGRLTPRELTEARDDILGDTADPNAMLGGLQTAGKILHSNLRNAQQVGGVKDFGQSSGADVQLPPGWTVK